MDSKIIDPITRIETGVHGFEQISRGGLVRGRTTLVVGSSGSGKTLFSSEILYRGVTQFNRRAVFVTFEERPEDVVRNVRNLNWGLLPLIRDGKIALLDASPDLEVAGEIGQYDLSGILAQIVDAIRESGAKLLVLDSISSLFLHYDQPGILRRELLRMCNTFRELGVTTVLTAERLDEYGPISRFGIEEFVADCVIILRHELNHEKVRRTIQIHKLRGDRHLKDEFPFTIQDRGLYILPLSAAELTQKSTARRIGFGNSKLDQMAGGGLFHDSVILSNGPTGSGKTLLATTFAAEACRRGERALFFGLEESQPQLIRNSQSWGIDFEGWEKKGLLEAVCRYPEAESLEGHLYQIHREIEEFRPQRVVVDSVSALERVGNTRSFREFVIGLTCLVKTEQICTMFTTSSPQLSGGDSITDAHISTITDAIVLLRYFESGGDLSRGMIIIKMRGSQHDKKFYEFTIDDSGLHVGESVPHVPSSLLGLTNTQGGRNGSHMS